MKLSDYAKYMGIAYHTAWKHYKNGLISYPTRQLPSGAVIVDFDPKNELGYKKHTKAAIYTRVPNHNLRSHLDSNVERLSRYCEGKGYQIIHVVKEVGSELNDNRKRLTKLLKQDDYDVLVIENKNQLSSTGVDYIDILLSRLGIKLDIMNLSKS